MFKRTYVPTFCCVFDEISSLVYVLSNAKTVGSVSGLGSKYELMELQTTPPHVRIRIQTIENENYFFWILNQNIWYCGGPEESATCNSNKSGNS